MAFGKVEKLILALKELGLIATHARFSYKGRRINPIKRIENKIISIFMDGKHSTKTARISKARANIKRKSRDISQYDRLPDSEKNQYLRTTYLHIYIVICHAIERDSLSILQRHVELELEDTTQPNYMRRHFSGSKPLTKLQLHQLYFDISFFEQITSVLREKLQLPRFPVIMSTLANAYSEFRDAWELQAEAARKIVEKEYLQKEAKEDELLTTTSNS